MTDVCYKIFENVVTVLIADIVLQEEFGSAKIVVMTFGAIEGAKRWREDVKCEFKILVDSERRLYNYLGLYGSLQKVCISTLL